MPTSFRITSLDPFTPIKGTKRQPGSCAINLLHLNKDTWQQELLKKRSGKAMNWWVYKGVDAEYVRQMLATNPVEKPGRTGRIKREWVVEGHRQDHYWDAESYTLALANVFGLGGAVIRGVKGRAHRTKRKKAPEKPRGAPPRKPSFWD